MPPLKLSHTAQNTYADCPKKYKLKYIDRYREKVQSSALHFGSAIDLALNSMLKGKDDWLQVFNSEWSKIGEMEVKYFKVDTDIDLIPAGVPEEKQAWYSLKEKGILLLLAYKNQIMPRIKNVLDVQREITIQGQDGDYITGFVDMICEWEDGTKVIFDNKTANRPYDLNAAGISPQLGLYCFALENYFNTRHVGFIVMNKRLKKVKTCLLCDNTWTSLHSSCPSETEGKRCHGEAKILPLAKIDVIIEEMAPAMDEEVVNKFEATNLNIKAEKFEPNLKSCTRGTWVCEFFDYCHSGDDSGLIKLLPK